VLPANSRVLDWFTRHRTGVERVVDWFWYVLVAATLIGVIAAFARRNHAATSLLPIPFALAVIYVLFFAEARYHLPVAVLLMPFAGAGLVWVGEAVRDLARFTIDRQRRPRLLYEGVLAPIVIAALFIGWPRMLAAGARLRAEHRWAVAVCDVEGAKRICEFRPVLVPGQESPLRGTWDGFGLRLIPPATTATATTDIDLPAGKYAVSMRVECGDRCLEDAKISLIAGSDVLLPNMLWPPPGEFVAMRIPVTHAGGKLHLEVRIDGHFAPATGAVGRSPTSAHAKYLRRSDDVAALWIAAFGVEREDR
jgi:hypothetical protein